MKRNVVIVTGIPGVGKTTVLRELEKLAELEKLKITIINYGSMMLEANRLLGEALGRDDLRHASIRLQKKLQDIAAVEIDRRIDALKTVVIDTHMIITTDTGYWPGLPFAVLEKLKPDLLVLIEADPKEIVMRRTKDRTRMRNKVTTEKIKEEIELARLIAASCATLTGAPVKIVDNPTKKTTKAAKEILDTIKMLGEEHHV